MPEQPGDPVPPRSGLPASRSGRTPAWVYDEAARAQVTGTRPNFGPFGEPPPGGPPGFYGGTSDPAGTYHLPGSGDRPRRSLTSRLLGLGVIVAIGLAAVFVAADLLRATRVPPELLGSYAERADLPPPLGLSPAADQPSPGFGEHSGPLGSPAEVANPNDAWEYQITAAPRDGGEPVLWSPCRPIHYVVNTDEAPDDFLLRVTEVVEEVSTATGLAFSYDGTTTEPVSRGRKPFLPLLYGDRWAPVLVGWADAEQHPGLEGDVAGLAHVNSAWDRSTERMHFVSGQVVLDTAMARSWSNQNWYVGVLRHEFGHLVGLDHVEATEQLMHARAGVDEFKDGDLTGLAAMGAGPCAPRL